MKKFDKIENSNKNIRYNELFVKLSYLTKLNTIKQTDIGEALNIDNATINKRAKNNSKFSMEEIEKIEKYFNVCLMNVSLVENTFLIQNDEAVNKRAENFTDRLIQLQNKINLSDKDFAKLINITADEFREYKNDERKPNFSFLIKLKQYFKVSVDWLLFGD